jgi:TctA family transporter
MKTVKFIIGIALGSLFGLIAANGIAILFHRLYWSRTYSVAILIMSAILSAACFY